MFLHPMKSTLGTWRCRSHAAYSRSASGIERIAECLVIGCGSDFVLAAALDLNQI